MIFCDKMITKTRYRYILLINPEIRGPEYEAFKSKTNSEVIYEWHQIRKNTPGKISSSINIGLLSIASYLSQYGYKVEILDLMGDKHDLDSLKKVIFKNEFKVVGISNLFYCTMESTLEYASMIKQFSPDIKIIVGGTHLPEIVHILPYEVIKNIDFIVKGEGEIPMLLILKCLEQNVNLCNIPNIYINNRKAKKFIFTFPQKLYLKMLPEVDYEIYPHFQKHPIVIEIDRGCPFNCEFCIKSPYFRIKSFKKLRNEFQKVFNAKDATKKEINIIIASNTFGLNKRFTLKLLDLLVNYRKKYDFRWGAQTRPDIFYTNYLYNDAKILEKLVSSGLKSLSLGLESASPRILSLMNKTKNPIKYIKDAEKTICILNKYDSIYCRPNFIIYAGENFDSVNDTFKFLYRNIDYLKGIHVSTIMMYPNSLLWEHISVYTQLYGTQVYKDEYWEKVKAYPLSPSSEINFLEAKFLERFMTKIFNRRL